MPMGRAFCVLREAILAITKACHSQLSGGQHEHGKKKPEHPQFDSASCREFLDRSAGIAIECCPGAGEPEVSGTAASDCKFGGRASDAGSDYVSWRRASRQEDPDRGNFGIAID